jgi:hypothetical protein
MEVATTEPNGFAEPSVELGRSNLEVEESPDGVMVAEGRDERATVDEGACG